MLPLQNPDGSDPFQGYNEARFLAMKAFAIRLGFLFAALPLLVFLLPSQLRTPQGPVNICWPMSVSLLTVTYPLALFTRLPRKALVGILYGGVSMGLGMGIWTLSLIPHGFVLYMWILLYPLFMTSMLATPFDLRANLAGSVVLLLIPPAMVWTGAVRGFPLARFYVMVLPLVLVISCFMFLLEGILKADHGYLKRIEHLAQRDGLTGTFNRRFFMEEADRLMKLVRRTHLPCSLIMIDIDHFKLVNDRYGHPAGDQVIRETARVVQLALRETDLFGRIGGEEFVAFLPDANLESGLRVAERVRAAIEQTRVPVPGLETPICFTISLGVVSAQAGGFSLDDLLERADKALYAAKQGGRNRAEANGSSA
ncbi:MAG: GGDEF domain-containing protein [Holophaga sp.]|nr:GGDEF domain-containing protein [Holophaga sp.]